MGKCLKQGTKAKNELGVLLQRIKKALFSILKKEHNSLLPKLELGIVTLSPKYGTEWGWKEQLEGGEP